MSILKRFSTRDLIIITALVSLGIAIKPVVGPLSKLLSTPLGIPGGSFAGGFYMMWLSLAVCIVDRRFTGTLFGLLQAILVLMIGMAGKQGAFSLISYTLPGIIADMAFFIIKRPSKLFTHLTLCALANITGAVVTGLFFFRMPALMVGVSVAFSLASGIVGGYLAYGIYKALRVQRNLLK